MGLSRSTWLVWVLPLVLAVGCVSEGGSTIVTPRLDSPTTTWAHAGWDWHSGIFQSRDYSCGLHPSEGCDGVALTLTDIWLGSDQPGVGEDWIDFIAAPELSDLVGWADELAVDMGHGVRIVPLTEPPAGFDVGEAWLEVTVSSVSASEFAARPASSLPEVLPSRAVFDSFTWEPGIVDVPAGQTELIEAMALTETTPTMMRWVIGLEEPGEYQYAAGYWYSGGFSALHVRIYKG